MKNESLEWIWRCFYLSVLILPLFPALGGVGLMLVAIALWRSYPRSLLQLPLNRGFLLFSGWLVLSACLAQNRLEAFLGTANFIPFIALAIAFSFLIKTTSQLRQLAWLLVIPSGLISLLGLGQLFFAWNSPIWLAHIVGWHLVAGGEPAGRMSSVFMYANLFAAYLVVVFLLGLGLWIDAFQIWWQDVKKRSFNFVLAILAAILVIDGLALLLTNSRNAWGLAFLACVAYALYLGWHWLVIGVAAAVSSIVWASWGPSPGREWLRGIVPAFFWARLSDEMYPDRPLATLRSTQWRFAWEMMFQRPWTGWGLRNFTPLYQAKMSLWLGHPHNLFLMLLAEIGLPGTILLCGLVGWILMRAIELIASRMSFSTDKKTQKNASERLIFFSYLLAFTSCILFNLFDVTVFDLRVNTIGWLLFSAIAGVVLGESKLKFKS
jgi:O-antigen ligase